MDAEHERVIVTKSGTYTRRCVRIGPKASLVIELGGERVVIRATSRSRVSVEATENRPAKRRNSNSSARWLADVPETNFGNIGSSREK